MAARTSLKLGANPPRLPPPTKQDGGTHCSEAWCQAACPGGSRLAPRRRTAGPACGTRAAASLAGPGCLPLSAAGLTEGDQQPAAGMRKCGCTEGNQQPAADMRKCEVSDMQKNVNIFSYFSYKASAWTSKAVKARERTMPLRLTASSSPLSPPLSPPPRSAGGCAPPRPPSRVFGHGADGAGSGPPRGRLQSRGGVGAGRLVRRMR